VFSQIFEKIHGYAPPSSGPPFTKIFDDVTKHLTEKGRVMVVALDDINYLFHRKKVNDVLYSLLRAHEMRPGARIGVIGIMSDKEMRYPLDPKVRSVFRPQEVYFPLYEHREIYDILKNRVRYGFFPGVVSEDVLNLIVKCVEDSEDLRVGIDLLKQAGLDAEHRGSKQISLDDVEKAYESSKFEHLAHAIQALRKGELTLLRLIAETREAKAGELYKRFHEVTDLGYTSFHEMLNELDAAKLVYTDYAGKGVRGRSRTIFLRYDADEVLKRLEKDR